MSYFDIPTTTVQISGGETVTMRLQRTLEQEEAAARNDQGRIPTSELLGQLIESWSLPVPVTRENVARLKTADAVLLLDAFNRAEQERKQDLDFTVTSPTGREENEPIHLPVSDSSLSTESAGGS